MGIGTSTPSFHLFTTLVEKAFACTVCYFKYSYVATTASSIPTRTIELWEVI